MPSGKGSGIEEFVLTGETGSSNGRRWELSEEVGALSTSGGFLDLDLMLTLTLFGLLVSALGLGCRGDDGGQRSAVLLLGSHRYLNRGERHALGHRGETNAGLAGCERCDELRWRRRDGVGRDSTSSAKNEGPSLPSRESRGSDFGWHTFQEEAIGR